MKKIGQFFLFKVRTVQTVILFYSFLFVKFIRSDVTKFAMIEFQKYYTVWNQQSCGSGFNLVFGGIRICNSKEVRSGSVPNIHIQNPSKAEPFIGQGYNKDNISIIFTFFYRKTLRVTLIRLDLDPSFFSRVGSGSVSTPARFATVVTSISN